MGSSRPETGRQRFQAAFGPVSPGGGRSVGPASDGPASDGQICVVAAYDSILVRDHWAEMTDEPWWHAFDGVREHEEAWARDYAASTGLDWLTVRPCRSREERARRSFDVRGDGTWLVDDGTGRRTRLSEPTVGGTNTGCAQSTHYDLEKIPTRREQVDALIRQTEPFDADRFAAEGRDDAARAIAAATNLVPYAHVASPAWSLYGLLGYEGMMIFLAEYMDLARYACTRILHNAEQQILRAAALGAEAVWIEECLTDQISPETFEAVSLPALRSCVRRIQAAGMRAVYYYCGNPNDRLDLILSAGSDGVHFEESKKGFVIEIENIVRRVDGRCTVFGNVDTVGVLEQGSDDLLADEIRRQIEAGRRNGGRFVLSTGSPITPGTPLARVRRYAELARELERL